MKYYTDPVEEVLSEVKSTESGLSSEEAKKRRDEVGANKLRQAKGKSLAARFLEQLADPMILIQQSDHPG